MDTIKFAELISYLTAIRAHSDMGFSASEIEHIRICVKESTAPQPKFNLLPLFTYMDQGRKIEAIKEFRALTGEGMKESRDMIDMIMNKFERNATLGDILKTATTGL